MLQVLVNLTESAYKEMCKNGIDNVDYDIRELMKNGKVINNDRSLCDSCATRGCVLQSGVVRKHCDFYTEEAEPCEDAISRSQALKELEESAKHHANDSREEVLLRRDRDIIRALPPVKSAACIAKVNFSKEDMQEIVDKKVEAMTVRKKGHWIMTNDYFTGAYGTIDYVKCSCCGEDSLEEGNFCPNCGAEMENEE